MAIRKVRAKAMFAILVAAVSCTSVLGQADSPPRSDAAPYELKGDRLGSSLVEFKTRHSESFCSDAAPEKFSNDDASLKAVRERTVAGLIECRIAPATVATVAVPFLSFSFVDGRLYQISCHFQQKSHAVVWMALRDKYGEPPFIDKKEVQNLFGATFSTRSYAWNNNVSSIYLVERNCFRSPCSDSDLETSFLAYSHKSLAEDAEGRRPKVKSDL